MARLYLWSLLLLVTPALALDTVEAEAELGWGQQHVRDQAEAALVVVVPGEGEAALRLADIPHNSDWGLVELSSDTDLQSAEAGQQGESFAPSKMMIR